MANSPMNDVLRHLRRTSRRQADGGLTDGQLLERFLAARDEAAFEALLRRHGPMVLGVCRRVLGAAPGAYDAEDAFQATFLVLVHRAGSVAARESVGSWLYGVAYRTALKARAAAARRRAKEKQMARPEAVDEDDRGRALRPLIDQELSRLPEKYREPIVLCDLEGQTREEAARRLGCPEGTVSGRLARGRGMLAKRLARHGLLLSGTAVVQALAAGAASACVPVPLVGSTVRAAARVAAGHAATGTVSAPVAALTAGVLKTMVVNKIKLGLAVVLAVAVLSGGWGVYQTRAEEGPAQAGANQAAPAPGAPMKPQGKINLPVGPAPVQVLASIGQDGKLVIKTAMLWAVGVPAPVPLPAPAPLPAPGPLPALPANPAPPAQPLPAIPGAPAPGGAPNVPGLPLGVAPGAPAVAPGGMPAWELRSQTYNLDDVEVLDTRGKRLDKTTVRKRLRTETVALASMWGQKVDPLHLRVLRDGMLVFVLPAPRAIPGEGGPGPGIPALPPAPAVPQGGPAVAPGGVGVAPPATALPGNQASPVFPRP
jgi:RNA polymerase sigma factor (sigma-70 family)